MLEYQRKQTYMINDVSRKVNLSQKRIREYEKEGLIKPEREPKTNNRRYTDFEILQIKRINHLIHKRGFTIACLRNLLVLAPCWNVFACRFKEECPAHEFPHQACWQTRKAHKTKCFGPCEKCAIFINRHYDKEGILEKEYSHWPG